MRDVKYSSIKELAEVVRDAIANMENDFTIRNIVDVLSGLDYETVNIMDNIGLYVLTNRNGINGAVGIMNSIKNYNEYNVRT